MLVFKRSKKLFPLIDFSQILKLGQYHPPKMCIVHVCPRTYFDTQTFLKMKTILSKLARIVGRSCGEVLGATFSVVAFVIVPKQDLKF